MLEEAALIIGGSLWWAQRNRTVDISSRVRLGRDDDILKRQLLEQNGSRLYIIKIYKYIYNYLLSIFFQSQWFESNLLFSYSAHTIVFLRYHRLYLNELVMIYLQFYFSEPTIYFLLYSPALAKSASG